MLPRTAPLAIVLLAIVLLAAPASAQNVWTVAPAPAPADFAEIQAAVDAASDGDTIVVASGAYQAVTITAKSLSLVAEPGALVELTEPFDFGSLVIQSLSPTQSVSVRGIDAPLGSSGVLFQAGLVVRGCQGPVLVTDGEFGATPIGHPAGFARGAEITSSSSVAIVNCRIESLDNDFGPAPATHQEPGIYAADSNVFVYDTETIGVQGIHVLSGTLLASDCQVTGDLHALKVDDSFSGGGAFVSLHGSTLTFGAGFDAIQVEAGEVQELVGPLMTFDVVSPVREGQSAVESYEGNPGDGVLRALSPVLADGAFFAPSLGANFLGQPLFLRFRGILPASGHLVRMVPISDLGPGLAGVSIFEQGVFLNFTTAAITVSEPVNVVLLDASI